MKNKKNKNIINVILSILMLVFSINTVFASQPTSEKEIIIREYSIDGEEDYTEVIQDEIINNGMIYKLVDTEVLENAETENIEKTETVEKIIETKDNALQYFDETLEYNQDGLQGILTLDTSSLTVVENETESKTTYETKTFTTKEEQTYYNLESNDYALLPQIITKNGIVLKLVSAEFEQTNSIGLFKANCVYSANYTKKIPSTTTTVKNYKATVNYVGTLTKENVSSREITAYYENTGISQYESDSDDSNVIDGTIVSSETKNTDITIIAIIILVIIICLISIITILLKKARKKEKNNKN